MAGEHFVKNDTRAPDIAFFSVGIFFLVEEDFGG
jgi:hypothetical protein